MGQRQVCHPMRKTMLRLPPSTGNMNITIAKEEEMSNNILTCLPYFSYFT